MKEVTSFGEEFGKSDGSFGGEGGVGEEESFEVRVDGEGCSEGGDLGLGVVGRVVKEREGRKEEKVGRERRKRNEVSISTRLLLLISILLELTPSNPGPQQGL